MRAIWPTGVSSEHMDLLGALSVVLTAMVKFLFAGLLSYSLGHGIGLTILLTALGGLSGMVLFYLTGTQVLEPTRLQDLAPMCLQGHRPRRD
jgi:membrane protein DedA with SNARE-associated domain